MLRFVAGKEDGPGSWRNHPSHKPFIAVRVPARCRRCCRPCSLPPLVKTSRLILLHCMPRLCPVALLWRLERHVPAALGSPIQARNVRRCDVMCDFLSEPATNWRQRQRLLPVLRRRQARANAPPQRPQRPPLVRPAAARRRRWRRRQMTALAQFPLVWPP